MAIKVLWKFIKERFCIYISLPLSIILATGTCFLLCPQVPIGFWRLITLNAVVFAGLLALRMADEISSLPVDKILHPERGLVNGSIPLKFLKLDLWLLLLGTAILALFNEGKGVFFFVVGAYFLFYHFRPQIPFRFQTLFVNMFFFFLPFYITKYFQVKPDFSLFVSAFLWLSVIGHELTHSIDAHFHSQVEPRADKKYFSLYIQIFVGVLCYIFSFFSATLAAWYLSNRLFFFCLIPWTIIIGALSFRLFKHPTPQNAKTFYIHGFLFFLFPLLVEALWGIIK